MTKKIAGLFIVCLVAVFCITSIGRTNYKAYYSGDAVNYQGNLIIASTDSGSLEIFKLNGSTLERESKFKAPNSPLDKTQDFSSVKLNVENGHLFAYATSAYTLYKYDLSDVSKPVIFAQQKNTYYEWYQKVDKFGDNIVTVSDKNVRVWKIDANTFDVIDSYKISNDVSNAVRFDASGRYITTINKDDIVRIFDAKTRSEAASFPVNFRSDNGQRKTYFDPIAKELYVFDDYYLKRYDVNGNLLLNYSNSATNGYAVEPAGDYGYVYAANGNSVLKLDKENLKSGLKVSSGSITSNGYAMGLKYVDMAGKDNLVVFNGGGIAVLDSSLHKIASVQATEIAEQPEAKEALALSFDHYTATPDAIVTLSGMGYLPNEDLSINFGGTITKIKADNNGRFKQSLTVPNVAISSGTSKSIDAKVDGVSSKLTYSTSFKVSK